MRLIRFTTPDSPNPSFGVIIGDQAVPFTVLQSRAGKFAPSLDDSRSYVAPGELIGNRQPYSIGLSAR